MLKVGVVLANELGSEGWRHEDARRKVSVFVDSETIAECERVGCKGLEKVGFIVLSVFPFHNRSGQIGMEGVAENLEQGGGPV